MRARLFITWLLLSLLGAAAVANGADTAPALLVAGCALWGALCAAGARSGILLGAARKGLVPLERDAPAHRLWRGGAFGLVAGAVVGSLTGLVASALVRPSRFAGWAVVLVVTSSLAFGVGSWLARRSLARPRSKRTTTLLAWVLLDTALPVGVLAAMLGAMVARLRFEGGTIGAVEASRHLALTLLLYGVLLGLGGGLKTAREKLGGLVDAPTPTFEAPGSVATGGVLGLAVLVLGPHLLGDVDTEVFMWMKGTLGLTIGTGLCALGALRGARRGDVEQP